MTNKIVEQSDSLIGLLTAQCADLEKLLVLAREETSATEQGNFNRIFEIVSERAVIGERLETFQKQIIGLREFLGANEFLQVGNKTIKRIEEIASSVLHQDCHTKLLLHAECDKINIELKAANTALYGTSSYLRDTTTKGLAYNESF